MQRHRAETQGGRESYSRWTRRGIGGGGGGRSRCALCAQDLDLKRGVDTCGAKGCKFQNVKLLGRVCRHCHLVFCNEHAIPEAHG